MPSRERGDSLGGREEWGVGKERRKKERKEGRKRIGAPTTSSPSRFFHGIHSGNRPANSSATCSCPPATATCSGVSLSALREMPSCSSWPAVMRYSFAIQLSNGSLIQIKMRSLSEPIPVCWGHRLRWTAKWGGWRAPGKSWEGQVGGFPRTAMAKCPSFAARCNDVLP